jgi:hypothetical protein
MAWGTSRSQLHLELRHQPRAERGRCRTPRSEMGSTVYAASPSGDSLYRINLIILIDIHTPSFYKTQVTRRAQMHAKFRPRAHAPTAALVRDSRDSPASAPRRCRTRTGGRTARPGATSLASISLASDPLRAGLAFSQIQGHCATQWLVVVSGTVLTWWL